MPRTGDGRGVAYASTPTLARSVTAAHHSACVPIRDVGDDYDDVHDVARGDDDHRDHNSRGRVLPPTPREIARCLRMHCDCDDGGDYGGEPPGGVGLGRAATLLGRAAAMVRIPRSVLDFPPPSPRPSTRRRGHSRSPGEEEEGRRRARGRYDPEASDRLRVLVGEAVGDLFVDCEDGGDPRRGCDMMARRALAAAEVVVDERLGLLGLGPGPVVTTTPGGDPSPVDAGARGGSSKAGAGRGNGRQRRPRDCGSRRHQRHPDILIGRKRRPRTKPKAYWTVGGGGGGGGDEQNDEEANEAEAEAEAPSRRERRTNKRRRTAPKCYWTASAPPSASTNAPSDDEGGGEAQAHEQSKAHEQSQAQEQSRARGAREEEGGRVDVEMVLRIRRGNAVTDILTLLLECLQLASAPHHSRWRSWGRKRRYEVYSLPAPVRPLSDGAGNLDRVRDALEGEFAHYYFSPRTTTTTEDDGGRRSRGRKRGRKPSAPPPSGCCRANALLVPNSPSSSASDTSNLLYLQLNLSDPRPLALESPSLRHARTGVKRTNAGDRYLCLLRPGSDVAVLTAGRSPGRLTTRTPFVLAAIVGALCCSDPGSGSGGRGGGGVDGGGRRGRGSAVCTKEYASSMRFMNLSGTDPLDLLSSALSHRSGSALGRYARLAERVSAGVDRGGCLDSLVDCGGAGRGGASSRSTTTTTAARDRIRASDPLVELEEVATGPLYERAREVERLRTASRHGSAVAALSASVADATGGTSSLVAVTTGLDGGQGAPGVIVDHGSSLQAMCDGAADQELGGPGDCPARQRVCWKWTGHTRAASDCWGDKGGLDGGCGAYEEEGNCVEAIIPSKEQLEFKCGVVFEGPNVFDGLRSLVSSGMAETPLPDFVRDAPMMGCNVIAVHHGKRVFGSGDDFAAV